MHSHVSISGTRKISLLVASLLWGGLTASGLPALAADGRPLLSPAEIPEVASYTLRAELDPVTHRLLGRGQIQFSNRSDSPTVELWFHLYLNAFRNSASTFLREDPESVETLAEQGWGWTEIRTLRDEAGHDLLPKLGYASPDDGNPDDRTVARVPLAAPLAPGGTLRLEISFEAQLPRVVERTGFKNGFHLVAQWFPKLGVHEPDGTWSCPQFHASSEFYADYGDYDVTLVLPRGIVVGATGTRVSESVEADGRIAYRHTQAGVHDFAWTAWSDFVERRRVFRHPGLPETEMILLLRRETAGFAERYFRALENGLRYLGEWYGPYPYPTLTMVDPPWGASGAGGMEYPTFITTGTRVLNPLPTGSPEGVTVHELGHQWWYGLVASDEFRESFLDEGINTYTTARVLRHAYPPQVWSYRAWEVPILFASAPRDTPLDTSARFFRRPTVDPISRTAWGYLDSRSYGALTYSKMSLLMEQIERTVGPAAMLRGMRAYADRFRFRHPRTADLEQTLSRETGHDLSPLFRQALHGSDGLDYAIDSVKSSSKAAPVGVFGEGEQRRVVPEGEDSSSEHAKEFESLVVVRRLGGVRLPIVTELRFADGRTKRLSWDGEERWVRYRVTGPRLTAAVADPDDVMVLDVDRLNNSRRVEPDKRASRRWSQRLRFWVQNLLETFSTLALWAPA